MIRLLATKRGVRATLLALTVGLATLSGCAKSAPPDARGDCACNAGVVSPALLAFLSKARAAHHEADLAESSSDRPRAINALEQLVRGPRPAPTDGAPAPEVAEVLADTLARLADLRSDGGDFDAALRDVDAGFALATKPSHFRGHLFEILGVIHERRAKALDQAHDSAGAAAAKALALAAFESAIKIQDQVIDDALARARDGG